MGANRSDLRIKVETVLKGLSVSLTFDAFLNKSNFEGLRALVADGIHAAGPEGRDPPIAILGELDHDRFSGPGGPIVPSVFKAVWVVPKPKMGSCMSPCVIKEGGLSYGSEGTSEVLERGLGHRDAVGGIRR